MSCNGCDNDKLGIHILERIDNIQQDMFTMRESQARIEEKISMHVDKQKVLADQVKEHNSVLMCVLIPLNFFKYLFKRG